MFRIAVAHVLFESNSFSPIVVSLNDLRRQAWFLGDEIWSAGEGKDQIGGASKVARQEGVALVPTIWARADPARCLTDDAFREIHERILAGISGNNIDGVYLSLHGASATESEEDPEGRLISDVKTTVGSSCPVAVSFDFHGNITELKAHSADILVGYQTCPHTDMFSTGERAMRLLIDAAKGNELALRYCKIPMIAPAEAHDTRIGPMRKVMEQRELCERRPGIRDISIFMTQPWLDVREQGGATVVMAAKESVIEAQSIADDLGMALWHSREKFKVCKTPISDVLTKIGEPRDARTRPIVVSDGADSTSGGSCGDGTEFLAALLENPPSYSVLLSVTDPEATAICFAKGVGGDVVSLSVGGKLLPNFHKSVTISGRIITLCDGRYQSEYPPAPMNVGRIAVLESGNITVVVTEKQACMLDFELYKRAGVDLMSYRVVQVKSAGGYRQYYEPISEEVFDLDTIGPTDSTLTRLPFRHVDRPLWPFDSEFEFSCT